MAVIAITLSWLSNMLSLTTPRSSATLGCSLIYHLESATARLCAALSRSSTCRQYGPPTTHSHPSRKEPKAFRIPKPVTTRWSYIHRTITKFNECLVDVFAPVESAYRLHKIDNDPLPSLDVLIKLTKPTVTRLFAKVGELLGHFEQGLRYLEGTIRSRASSTAPSPLRRHIPDTLSGSVDRPRSPQQN